MDLEEEFHSYDHHTIDFNIDNQTDFNEEFDDSDDYTENYEEDELSWEDFDE